MNQTHETDTIVVGGGLAGLTTAVLLARAGRTVTLFEQSTDLGGRARTLERDGFRLNLGPHALYRGGAGMRVLKRLGIPLAGGVPSTGGYAIRGGRTYPLPGDPFAFLRTGLLSPGAKLELARRLPGIMRADSRAVEHLTVTRWLDDTIQHADLREFLGAFVRLTTYANNPDRQSAGAALTQIRMALTRNVLYLDGGWQSIVDALARQALAAGVRVVTGARVVAVEADEAARGVRLADGTTRAAQTVVIASSPAVARALIGSERVAHTSDWVERSVPVVAASLDIVLDALPRPRVSFALGIDRPLYFSVHSAVARLAPAGKAVVHATKYQNPSERVDQRADERELEGLLDLVQPGWRVATVYRRFSPHLVVSSALATADEGVSGRPGPSVPGVANLYVVGDWVGPEGLLADAALASARRCAEMVVATDASGKIGGPPGQRAREGAVKVA